MEHSISTIIAIIILIPSILIFITGLHKNHKITNGISIDEVKMKIKVNMDKPTNVYTEAQKSDKKFSDLQNLVQQPQKKSTPLTKIRDPIFFYFKNTNIINDSRLEYLGKSKSLGYPVYAMDKSNAGLLRGTQYFEVLNIEKELITK